MKTIINLTVLLLSMTAMVSSNSGQTTPAETNPAMAYYRAFLLAPDLWNQTRSTWLRTTCGA